MRDPGGPEGLLKLIAHASPVSGGHGHYKRGRLGRKPVAYGPVELVAEPVEKHRHRLADVAFPAHILQHRILVALECAGILLFRGSHDPEPELLLPAGFELPPRKDVEPPTALELKLLRVAAPELLRRGAEVARHRYVTALERKLLGPCMSERRIKKSDNEKAGDYVFFLP